MEKSTDEVGELSSKSLVPSIVGSLFRDMETLSAITPHGCRNACLDAAMAVERKAIPIDRNILVVLNANGDLVLFRVFRRCFMIVVMFLLTMFV